MSERERASVEFATIRDLSTARKLAKGWEELAESCDAGPFARPEYSLSWWEHLGKGRLLVATVRSGGTLVALAPLHERRVGPIWVARWLGHGLGTVGEVLVRPGHVEAGRVLWAGLSTRRRVLELVETNAGSAGLAELRERGSRPDRRLRESVRDRCPTTSVSGDGLDVVRQTGSRKLRRTLTVADRRVREAGSVFSIQVAEDPVSFEQLLPAVRQVFDVAEQDHPRQHFLREPYEGFTLELLRSTVATGRSAVIVGYVDERPISFNVVFLSPSTVWLWLARFDPEVAAMSPGHLLTRAVYTWSAETGRTMVDQLLGDSRSKMQWATGTYETLEITCGTPWALRVVSVAVRGRELIRRA